MIGVGGPRHAQVGQLGRRDRRATPGGVLGDCLQLRSHGRLRAVVGQCQMSRGLLRVIDDRGESLVRVFTLQRRGTLVALRGEQRMSEAHGASVDLDDSFLDRHVQRGAA